MFVDDRSACAWPVQDTFGRRPYAVEVDYNRRDCGRGDQSHVHSPPTPPRARSDWKDVCPGLYYPSGQLTPVYQGRMGNETSASRYSQTHQQQGHQDWPAYRYSQPDTQADNYRHAQSLHSAAVRSHVVKSDLRVPAASSDLRSHGYASTTKRLQCDKCDGPHATDACPYFKGVREEHADAWLKYSGSDNAASSSKASRACSAPWSLTDSQVRVARMPGDGSCLFHSVAFGLSKLGYRENGLGVRQRLARFIADNPKFEISGTPLQSWVEWDSNTSVSEYASRLSSGSFWGGAIEMAACSRIFEVDIAVYEEHSYGRGFHRISDFLTDATPRGNVFLLYSGRLHYDALDEVSGQRMTRRTDHVQAEEETWFGDDCSLM